MDASINTQQARATYGNDQWLKVSLLQYFLIQ